MGSVCRQSGHRFGEHVEKVMPLVLAYAKVDDDELREHCLQACELSLRNAENLEGLPNSAGFRREHGVQVRQ